MIDSMTLSQEYALCSGREINKDLVLISHPRIILISLSLPSACSFFDEIKSFLGMMSSGKCPYCKWDCASFSGWCFTLSGATPIEPSMKMSILPESTTGMLTDTSLAWAKGMSSGKESGTSRGNEMFSNDVL
jgi:hypothetical protein